MPDNSVFLPKRDKEIEAYLDAHHIRTPNELRWYLKPQDATPLDQLRPFFDGKIVYIIGKGPSLDKLGTRHFEPDHPIICINDSVHRIEGLDLSNPIFVIQQDTWLKDRCRPKQATLIVSPQAAYLYEDIKNKYIFNQIELGITKQTITVCWGIQLAKYYGAINLIFLAFDAFTIGNTDYANSIGYPSSDFSTPKRFHTQKSKALHYLSDISYVFINPKDLD
jgi:hypothetical protein